LSGGLCEEGWGGGGGGRSWMTWSRRMLNVMKIGRRVEIKVVRYFTIPLEDEIRLSNIPKVSSYYQENTHTTTLINNLSMHKIALHPDSETNLQINSVRTIFH